MDDENDLFEWAANIYESDSLSEIGSQIDLTEYQVSLGPIYKEPTGEERIESIEVTKVT